MKVFSIPVVQATSPTAAAEPDEQRAKRAKLAKMLDESIAATLTKSTAENKGAKVTARRFG